MWCSNLKSVIAIAVLLICHSVAFPVHNENSNGNNFIHFEYFFLTLMRFSINQ